MTVGRAQVVGIETTDGVDVGATMARRNCAWACRCDVIAIRETVVVLPSVPVFRQLPACSADVCGFMLICRPANSMPSSWLASRTHAPCAWPSSLLKLLRTGRAVGLRTRRTTERVTHSGNTSRQLSRHRQSRRPPHARIDCVPKASSPRQHILSKFVGTSLAVYPLFFEDVVA